MVVAVVEDAPQVVIYSYENTDIYAAYSNQTSPTYPYTLTAVVFSKEGELLDESEYNLVWSSEDESIAII